MEILCAFVRIVTHVSQSIDKFTYLPERVFQWREEEEMWMLVALQKIGKGASFLNGKEFSKTTFCIVRRLCLLQLHKGPVPREANC